MLLFLASVVSSAPPSCDYSDEQIETMTDATATFLRRHNYTVQEGQFKVFNSSSFGANPGNPYATYFHPGLVQKRLPLFKLGATSAALFIGCTPSTPAYFSWRSYAFTSRGKLVFASLGDTLNNLVINTTSNATSANRETGGRLTAVATTSDSRSLAQITAAVQAAGLPPSALNLDAVPSSLLDIGHDPTLRFIMLHRASVWGDPAQKASYFAQTRRVLFIESAVNTPPEPLALLPLRPAGTGVRESSMKGITEGLTQLRQAVVESLAQAGYKLSAAGFMDGNLTALGLDGFKCLKAGTNCKGDNRDTHYLQYHDSQFLDTDQYVLIGTNSVKTGKCTYSNFGLYEVAHTPILNRTKLTSTDLTVDNRQTEGSAEYYGVDNSKLFAYRLSRDCSAAEYCLQVDKQQVKGGEWAVAYRPYLEPATATGPKLSELILPKILKFSKA